jgi:hypothetical protein
MDTNKREEEKVTADGRGFTQMLAGKLSFFCDLCAFCGYSDLLTARS